MRSVPTTKAASSLRTKARAPMQETMKPGWVPKILPGRQRRG